MIDSCDIELVGGDYFADSLHLSSSTTDEPTQEGWVKKFFKSLPSSAGVMLIICSNTLSDESLPPLVTKIQSSSAIAIEPQSVPAQVASPEKEQPLSEVDHLAIVQTRLGLSKVQLAKICGVERQTIYDWINEKHLPSAENSRRIYDLYSLAKSSILRGLPTVNPKTVERPLQTGATLLDLLVAESLDAKAVNAALGELAEQERARTARSASFLRDRQGWKPLSEQEKSANLEYNLTQLGLG